MKRPRTSFRVVTNGPVANAGSILYLFNKRGIKVQKIPAKMITTKRDILTTSPRVAFPKKVAIP